ncbi:MAG TPA: ATP-binding protein [Candidatus Polarisedimenticolia bacterium]|nr:ATP-binding protein [Candidatus Polarisedimenticolia bacterium]
MKSLTSLIVAPRSTVSSLLTGLACAAGAMLFRLLLNPLLGVQAPRAFFFIAVLAASLFGGPIGAWSSVAASALLGIYAFPLPQPGLPALALPNALSLGVFIVVAACIAAMGTTLRRLMQEESARTRIAERDSDLLMHEKDVQARLLALADRCASPAISFRECLDEILQVAMWLCGAHQGTLQILDDEGRLRLEAHAGFPPRFLEFFALVQAGESAACGESLLLARRVIVEDVTRSPLFAKQPALPVLLEAKVRAVQSTPLKSGSGKVLGIFSTHFSEPHRPSLKELADLDFLARQAADLLERKRAEEALEDSRRKLQRVTGTMTAPVTHCSRDLRYVWVNRPYADWLGRGVEEITGALIADVIGKEAFEQLRPKFEQVLRGEEVRYEEEVHFPIGPRWIAATYTPTFDSGGVCDGWVAVVIDIHDRKVMEQALAEQSRRKDEFLAMLGHELRNPLAAIRYSLVAAGVEGPHRNEALDIARRQTEQLGRLIDDLLDVARITQGRINLRRAPVALQSVARRALEAVRPLCEARGHALGVDMPAEDLLVEGDAARLEQVIVNLLSNACKYTDTHGQLFFSLTRKGSEAILRVRDSGVGIAAELLPRVFDLFAQSSQSLERSQGGLGIGLTVARRLVELHGGSIEAHSDGEEKGAEFVIRLPLFERPAPSPSPEPEAGRYEAAARRILVVEDNPDAARSLRLLLEKQGHVVRVTGNGHEALEAVHSDLPEVLIVDIGLPEMDGFELARRVKADPKLRDLALIALTGYGSEQDKRASAEAGFLHHLVKPADPEILEGLLRRLASPAAETKRA